MNLPGLHTDQDLALADGRLRLLQDLHRLESAEAGEDDSAHLLGRGSLLLFLLDRFLWGLFRRGLGAAILSRGRDLLRRCGHGCLCAFRHVCRVSEGSTGGLADAVRMSPDECNGSRPARRRVAERMTRGKGAARAPGEGVESSGGGAESVGRGLEGERRVAGGGGGATGRGAGGGYARQHPAAPRTGGHRAGRFPPRAYPALRYYITYTEPGLSI